MEPKLTGVVLAGGQSRRMGRNKALMVLEGQPLVARVLARLSPLCDELIISANDPAPYADLPARVVPDVIKGRGALSGIHASLAAMRHRWAVVVACDMPFVNQALLGHMATLTAGCDVVVPRVKGEYEPLHALYSTACVAPIADLIAERPQRLVALYHHVRVRVVPEETVRSFDPELRSFVNVNTPQEWTALQRMLE